tara:strand:+ start:226 stop:471 length:246 start_codon:yes stop_codon:yes gene_type:complete
MTDYCRIILQEKDMGDGSFCYDITLAQGSFTGKWREELQFSARTKEDAYKCVEKIQSALVEHCLEMPETNVQEFMPSEGGA